MIGERVLAALSRSSSRRSLSMGLFPAGIQIQSAVGYTLRVRQSCRKSWGSPWCVSGSGSAGAPAEGEVAGRARDRCALAHATVRRACGVWTARRFELESRWQLRGTAGRL
jgi:hypothetical protein